MCCTKLSRPGLFGPEAAGGPPGLEGEGFFEDEFLPGDEPWFADGAGGALIGSFAEDPTGAVPPATWGRGFFP